MGRDEAGDGFLVLALGGGLGLGFDVLFQEPLGEFVHGGRVALLGELLVRVFAFEDLKADLLGLLPCLVHGEDAVASERDPVLLGAFRVLEGENLRSRGPHADAEARHVGIPHGVGLLAGLEAVHQDLVEPFSRSPRHGSLLRWAIE